MKDICISEVVERSIKIRKRYHELERQFQGKELFCYFNKKCKIL